MNIDDEIDTIASLQSFLIDVTLETVEDSTKKLLESDLIHTKSGIRQIVSAILVAANARPTQIPAQCQLACALFASANSENALSHVQSRLRKMLFRLIECRKPVPSEATSFAFLFQSYKHGLFSIDSLLLFANRLTEMSRLVQSTYWLLSYFAPELEKANSVLASNLIARLQKNSTDQYLPSIFKEFSDTLETLRANNWSRLKQKRDFFTDDTDIMSIIRDDDLCRLQQFCQNPTTSIDTRLPQTPFLSSSALFNNPTLLQAAAFFGSVKCFRWLLTNGADPHATTRCFTTVTQLAVAGGNIEIIRLCQHHCLDFSCVIHWSIRHHQHALFDWLPLDTEEIDVNGFQPIHAAAHSNNLIALQRLLFCGANTTALSIHHCHTALHIAVSRCHSLVVRLLLSRAADVNIRGHDGDTPLSLSVK
jgi:hypothetical protein